MKRAILTALIGVVVAIAAGSIVVAMRERRRQMPLTAQPVPTVSVPGGFESAPAEDVVPSAYAPIENTEQDIVEPVPYFPPPTLDLTGGRLGNQVVPGTDGIGDVYNVFFYNPTQTLFMAVVEPDGLRSIWRLTEKGVVERVFVADKNPGEITIDADSKDIIYVQFNNPARVFRSADGLKTWRLVLEGKGNFWSIASDNRGNVYGSLHDYNTAVLYRSPDDGFSWEPWVDFHKVFPEYATQYSPQDPRFRMRHLHTVIYSEKSDSILVGTGDVARFTLRSDDDGRTWRKVWDEGFTAAVPVGGGNRYLLGPDSLHKHPMVIYDAWADTVKTVWNPIDHGYAGYTYSLLNAEGTYYAAFHTEANEVETIVPKFGIIASPDGEHWYQFLEWGPLGNHARTNIWLASAPNRIYASVNGRLYAYKPLDKAWFEGKSPFGAGGSR